MSVLVIGGGVSGLACAYRLKQLGVAVRLLERSHRVGGVVQSHKVNGFQFDLGPQSFLSSDLTLKLIAELGLEREMLQANPRAPRFILFKGDLHRAPMAPPALLGTTLLSASTKLRLLMEPLRTSRPPVEDESAAAFARRKFGSDLLDNLLAPFVSGVYAGDPEQISFRSAFPSAHRWEVEHGSVIRGAMKSRPPKDKPRPVLTTFHGGLQKLLQGLAGSLGDALECGVEVLSLGPGQASGFRICTSQNGETIERGAKALVLAVPAYAAATLLAGLSQSTSEALAQIEYAPVAVTNLGYRREQISHPLDGFGFLVPRTQGQRLLGTIWSSSLFPGRTPEGMASLASFLGGATDPSLLDLDDTELLQIAASENARILGIRGDPVVQHLQRYSRAIPQYNLGHAQILRRLRLGIAGHPKLFVAGNYMEGPAISSCVENGFTTADAVHKAMAKV